MQIRMTIKKKQVKCTTMVKYLCNTILSNKKKQKRKANKC